MRLIACAILFVLTAVPPAAAQSSSDQSQPAAVPAAPAEEAPKPAGEDAAKETPKVEAETTDTAQPGDQAALRAMVRKQAEQDGLPPEIAEAVAEVESGFNTRAVGGVGEIGLMQILPSTARMLGFDEPLPKLFEPGNNIRYGVRYLSDAWRLTGNDICATVMKYRAGHGETRYSQKSVAYCVRVRALLAARGYKVTGTVPVATFGFGGPTGLGLARGKIRIGRRLPNGRVRMVFDWRPVDLKRKSLDRAVDASLRIAN